MARWSSCRAIVETSSCAMSTDLRQQLSAVLLQHYPPRAIREAHLTVLLEGHPKAERLLLLPWEAAFSPNGSGNASPGDPHARAVLDHDELSRDILEDLAGCDQPIKEETCARHLNRAYTAQFRTTMLRLIELGEVKRWPDGRISLPR